MGIKENQEPLPTLYFINDPIKTRFIANSGSCTTIELSKLLTSCLTAVKNHLTQYCEIIYERDVINLFWSIKNSKDVLNKFKSKRFKASKLYTYDFFTLYTTLPQHLFKDKLIDLIERTFSREKHFIWRVMKNVHFSLLLCTKMINYCLVKKFVNPLFIFWIIYY